MLSEIQQNGQHILTKIEAISKVRSKVTGNVSTKV